MFPLRALCHCKKNKDSKKAKLTAGAVKRLSRINKSPSRLKRERTLCELHTQRTLDHIVGNVGNVGNKGRNCVITEIALAELSLR